MTDSAIISTPEADDEETGEDLGGLLGRAGEEGLGERWGDLGVGRGGYGSGCWSLQCGDNRETALNQMTAGDVSCQYLLAKVKQCSSSAVEAFR